MSRAPAARAAVAAQAAWGLVLAAAPERTAALACAGRAEPPTSLVRVLGLRLLAQSLWVLPRPDRARMGAAAVVDAVHAASMGLVAALSSTYRRAATVSEASSAVAAAADALLALRTRR